MPNTPKPQVQRIRTSFLKTMMQDENGLPKAAGT